MVRDEAGAWGVVAFAPVRPSFFLVVAVSCGVALCEVKTTRAEEAPATAIVTDRDAGQAALARIEDEFARVPRKESCARLDRLVVEHPDSRAVPRALYWHGRLALDDGDLARAEARFEALLGRRTALDGGDEAALAKLALAEIALQRHRWDEAARRYRALRGELPPSREDLRAQVAERLETVARERRREHAAWAALAVLASVLGGFAWRALRHRTGEARWRVPGETLYAAPVVALLVLAVRAADRRLQTTALLVGVGALALATLSGLALSPSRRGRPLHAALHLAAVVAAVASLLYLAAWRGDALDLVVSTWAESL